MSLFPLGLCVLQPINDLAKLVVNDAMNRTYMVQTSLGPVLDIGHGAYPVNALLHALLALGRDTYHGIVRFRIAIDPVKQKAAIQDLLYPRRSTFVKDSTKKEGPNNMTSFHIRSPGTTLSFTGLGQDTADFAVCWNSHLLNVLRNGSLPPPHQPQMIGATEETQALSQLTEAFSHLLQDAGSSEVLYEPEPSAENLMRRGTFGGIYRVRNLNSHELMALKTLEKRSSGGYQTYYDASEIQEMKYAIEMLSKKRHNAVVKYLGTQWWDDQARPTEIFMEFMDGSVASLIDDIRGDNVYMSIGTFLLPDLVSNHILIPMLSALDFLACHEIVHRDLKPANILHRYTSDRGLVFKLGNFGEATTFKNANLPPGGDLLYHAPELYLLTESESSENITSRGKIDVWSLFVTIVFVLDLGMFRTEPPQGAEAILTTLVGIANNNLAARDIQHMGIVAPAKRASAAQMLVKLRPGYGNLLTTKGRIPRLGAYKNTL